MRPLALDPAYPIPYFNLGTIAAVRENHELSDRMFAEARRLGFSRTRIDRAISRVTGAYARVQSLPK